MKRLRNTVLAGAVALATAAPAAAEVTLINVFDVPAGQEDTVIAAWEKARDFLAQEPGYISTALHRATGPETRFKLINIARWESPESFAAATAKMRAAGIFPRIPGLGVHPSLYRVIRTDDPAFDGPAE